VAPAVAIGAVVNTELRPRRPAALASERIYCGSFGVIRLADSTFKNISSIAGAKKRREGRTKAAAHAASRPANESRTCHCSIAERALPQLPDPDSVPADVRRTNDWYTVRGISVLTKPPIE
jgi:hypothetical protein